MLTIDNVKACPFCGMRLLTALTWIVRGQHGGIHAAIACDTCREVQGPRSDRHDDEADAIDDAVKRWNTRADSAGIPATSGNRSAEKSTISAQAE